MAVVVAEPAAGEVPRDEADAADARDDSGLRDAQPARAGQIDEEIDEGEADDSVEKGAEGQQPHRARYVPHDPEEAHPQHPPSEFPLGMDYGIVVSCRSIR